MDAQATSLRDWQSLPEDEQLQLRIDFGVYCDGLPPTCSMDEKNHRFSQWLERRNIRYRPK